MSSLEKDPEGIGEDSFKPMAVNTTGRGEQRGHIYDLTTIQQRAYRCFQGNKKTCVLFSIFITTCALFYVVYRVTHDQLKIDSPRVELLSDEYRPNHLRDLIRETSRAAMKSGALATILLNSKTEVIREDNIGFVLSSRRQISSSSSGSGTESTSIATPVKPVMTSDNLAVSSMDEKLVVHSLAQVSLTITLNKFNTIADHCLLVTNLFEPQLAPLSAQQLEVWHWSVESIGGVGFYNSNFLAGASQPRKHMQFAPLDSFWKYRSDDETYPIPLDDALLPLIEAKHWAPFSAHFADPNNHNKFAAERASAALIHAQPVFPFRHSVAVLMSRAAVIQEAKQRNVPTATAIDQEAVYGQYLEAAYEALLRSVGISSRNLAECAASSISRSSDMGHSSAASTDECSAEKSAYNLILTEIYMMIVPRSQGAVEGISINSFGYMGFLLSTSDDQKAFVRQKGPMDILTKAAVAI